MEKVLDMKRKMIALLAMSVLLCFFTATAEASDDTRGTQTITPLEITAVPDGDWATVFVRAESGPDEVYQLIAAAYDGEGPSGEYRYEIRWLFPCPSCTDFFHQSGPL